MYSLGSGGRRYCWEGLLWRPDGFLSPLYVSAITAGGRSKEKRVTSHNIRTSSSGFSSKKSTPFLCKYESDLRKIDKVKNWHHSEEK